MLIGQLPYWGQYKAALASDDAWAARLLDLEEAGVELPGVGDAAGGPPVTDYSPVVARLDLIADRVMAVRTAVQASYTREHQEPSFEPLPRPETALDRERERRTRSLLLEVDALVLGGGVAIIGME